MVEASAPSNIALIKYMGKIVGSGNQPTNASLSYSLDHWRTIVQLESIAGPEDRWAPLERTGYAAPVLSEKGREKFLQHFQFLKETFNAEGAFRIRSANNFPSDCGLASSASSFAALTWAAAEQFQARQSVNELSVLSRKGSGSSCRSFFTPWAIWEKDGAEAPQGLGFQKLLHAAVIVSGAVKEVSSSEAHVRVTTSPNFVGRTDRAEGRLRHLLACLKEENWVGAHEAVWEEFRDMHDLFETSVPPFRYRTTDSKNVVDACHHIWKFKKDGPLVTMDAGPNVHLLYRPEQMELAEKMVRHFREKHVVVTSWGGFR